MTSCPIRLSPSVYVHVDSGDKLLLRRTALTSGAALPLPFLSTRCFAASDRPGGREILLGQIPLLSGPFASGMQSVNAVAKLVLDAVNAGGVVHGRRARVVIMDDELKQEQTAVNFRTLHNDVTADRKLTV